MRQTSNGLFLTLGGLWVLALCARAGAALPPPPEPPENPTTEAKRLLGKVLFWDEQLSSDNTMSCGTCHLPEAGGSDNRAARNPGPDHALFTGDDNVGSRGVRLSTSLGYYVADPVFGYDVQVTRRIAPPAIMAAYFTTLFWDGRAKTDFIDPVSGSTSIPSGGALESQSVGPPVSGGEMAYTGRAWASITSKITAATPLALATNLPPDLQAAVAGGVTYPQLFQAAFGSPSIKSDRIAKAIAAYERTLVPDQSPWDRAQAGEPGAMTPLQIAGEAAFQSAFCDFCHSPPTFSNDAFHNIGVRPSAEDVGRQAVTQNAFDAGAFKTPTLRNAGLRPAYMHGGQIATIEDVLAFYGRLPGAAPQFTDNLDPVMPFVSVAPESVPAIAEFIRGALTDPRVAARQFPFDRPTLFSERMSAHISIISGSGVPGAAGVPKMIADAPPMLGNADFRLGVSGAAGPAPARVVYSASPPVAGRLLAQGDWGLTSTSAPGHATLFMPIGANAFAPGETVYAQWIITDPSAPEGEAASEAVSLTFFCARDACPAPACDPDVNQDGNTDQDDVAYLINVIGGGSNPTNIDPDVNHDGNTDQDDIAALINVVAGGACP